MPAANTAEATGPQEAIPLVTVRNIVTQADNDPPKTRVENAS
jgi:hypothetical protein